MTERGLPLVDGAPACPFVAFDDDRDERATSPDRRHRCYAESPPAPRALAHQEAYCLASSFPVCPTFQDWARREAARIRQPEPPSDEDGELAPLVTDRPARRGSGIWNAPPPWLRGSDAASPSGPEPGSGAPAATGGPEGPEGGAAESDEGGDAVAAGAVALGGGGAAAGAFGGGLSGSFADRLLSGAEPAASGGADAHPAPRQDLDRQSAEPPVGPPRRRDRERLDTGRDDDGSQRSGWAPPWERPRRVEAYPTVRSRGLPGGGLSSLLVAVVAVVLAAILLFFLPSFLGVGGPSATGSPAASASASVQPSESFAASGAPGATPQTYTVKKGDTMSKIATKYGVPLQALIDANKTNIPNPDVLKIGDVVIIPATTPTSLPGASASP